MAGNAEPRRSLANGAWAPRATAWSRADLAALVVLWLTAAVVAAPILFGGWNTLGQKGSDEGDQAVWPDTRPL